VLPLLDGCHSLAQPSRLWQEAGELGYVLARRRKTLKTVDLLIATYALAHAVPVLAAAADFAIMKRAGIPLLIVKA